MLITEHCLFVHIPKTGGSWIRHTISQPGVRTVSTDPPHCRLVRGGRAGPGRQWLPGGPAQLSFTFVRDPATWWRSWWQYAVRPGNWERATPGWPSRLIRHEWEPVDVHAACRTYQQFMERMLNDAPGIYSHAVRMYTMPVDRVGLFENLAGDLAGILEEAGQPADISIEPQNVAKYDSRADTTPELDRAVREAEKRVMEEFYPDWRG